MKTRGLGAKAASSIRGVAALPIKSCFIPRNSPELCEKTAPDDPIGDLPVELLLVLIPKTKPLGMLPSVQHNLLWGDSSP